MDREVALRLLREAAEKLVPISDEPWQDLAGALELCGFDRNETLVRAGEPISSFFFVVLGLVRYYYVTSEGKEFNKAFFVEGEFMGVVSRRPDEPSPFFIETLEPTLAVRMPRKVLDDVAARFPDVERLNRVQAERVARTKTQREADLLLESAQERFERFRARRPDLIARLSQRHIASYIGITDVALSRIAKRVRNKAE